jgi:hypothetical protein
MRPALFLFGRTRKQYFILRRPAIAFCVQVDTINLPVSSTKLYTHAPHSLSHTHSEPHSRSAAEQNNFRAAYGGINKTLARAVRWHFHFIRPNNTLDAGQLGESPPVLCGQASNYLRHPKGLPRWTLQNRPQVATRTQHELIPSHFFPSVFCCDVDGSLCLHFCGPPANKLPPHSNNS